jgi:hypothetical protein
VKLTPEREAEIRAYRQVGFDGEDIDALLAEIDSLRMYLDLIVPGWSEIRTQIEDALEAEREKARA